MCAYACMHACTPASVCVYVRACVHVRMCHCGMCDCIWCACVCACVRACMCLCTRACVCVCDFESHVENMFGGVSFVLNLNHICSSEGGSSAFHFILSSMTVSINFLA